MWVSVCLLRYLAKLSLELWYLMQSGRDERESIGGPKSIKGHVYHDKVFGLYHIKHGVKPSLSFNHWSERVSYLRNITLLAMSMVKKWESQQLRYCCHSPVWRQRRLAIEQG